MKRFSKGQVVFLGVVLFLSSGAFVLAVVPVSDVMNLKLAMLQTKMLVLLGRIEVNQDIKIAKGLYDQLDIMKRQYQTLGRQLDSMTGNRLYGDLLSSTADRQYRLYMPATWEATLKLVDADRLVGPLAQKIRDYRTRFAANGVGVTFDTNDGTKTYYQHSKKVTQLALAQSELLMDNIKGRRAILNKLTQQINLTQNVKDATDLNSRIQIEVLDTQIELLRVVALQSYLQGMAQQATNQNIENNRFHLNIVKP